MMIGRFVMLALFLFVPGLGVAQTKKQCIAAARTEMSAVKRAAVKEFQSAKTACRAQGGGGKGGGPLGCCLYSQRGGTGCVVNTSAQECSTGDAEGNFPPGAFLAFGSSLPDPVDPQVQMCCIAPANPHDKGNCLRCP
jgi:hypothetical protein